MPMPVITTRRFAGSFSTLDDMIVISFDRVAELGGAGNKSPGSARWTALNSRPYTHSYPKAQPRNRFSANEIKRTAIAGSSMRALRSLTCP